MATKKVRVRVSQLIDVELPEGVTVDDLGTPTISWLENQGDSENVISADMQEYVVGSDRIKEVEEYAQW